MRAIASWPGPRAAAIHAAGLDSGRVAGNLYTVGGDAMRTLIGGIFLSVGVVSLIPALAGAQSLAGVVRDTSGAVLPGVTVEASSPALIERTRSAVTDENGQYRITDLPPGAYKVTFTLAGFATVVRDGVELTGGGVTTINAELRVGALPGNDHGHRRDAGRRRAVGTRQQTVLSGDVVRALPASRGYGNYLAAVPAIQATGFNASAQPTTQLLQRPRRPQQRGQ